MPISLAHKSVTVDVNNRNTPNIVAIVNVNDKAVRYLDVTLTASGNKLTFTGCTATATFATDGVLISDAVACTLNSTADLITVPLEGFKSLSGFLSIEIKIANGETQVLNTPLTLKVQVTPSLADNSKINKDTVGTTAEICREVAAARGEYESVGERLDNLIPDEVDVITTDHMQDGAVKTLKIADGAVTQSKLSVDLKSSINSIANKANADDVNASLALKADKSTTLDGYGITDAYTKEKTNSLLKNKLDSMPFDAEPQINSPCYLTSGTVYNALAKKFDLSNIEYGKGNLSPAQTVYEGSEGNFNYSKIGKTVTVALNVTALTAGKSYVQLIGLPYRAITASRLSSVAVYTTTNKLVNLRVDGTWLYISSPNSNFAEDEKVNAIITYIIG